MTKSKKYAKTAILLLIILLLGSCGKKSEPTYPPQVSLSSGQIFLFHPYCYQLGIYDLELMEWREIDAQGAFFQAFDWGNDYPYFVVGAQNSHDFCAGKADASTLNFYYSLQNKEQALTPFATDGDQFFYLIEQVNDETCIKRVVTISEQGEMELVANLDGMYVMSGVIAGDDLYFTCSETDSDAYEVWRLDLTKETKEQKPVLVREDYHSFKLYSYNGKILYLDPENRSLYNADMTIQLSQEADLIWIDEEADLLVEEYVNDKNDLEMAFTDLTSGTVLSVYTDAINFIRTGASVTVYGNGFIEHLDL